MNQTAEYLLLIPVFLILLMVMKVGFAWLVVDLLSRPVYLFVIYEGSELLFTTLSRIEANDLVGLLSLSSDDISLVIHEF